jgi:hypothetical protein
LKSYLWLFCLSIVLRCEPAFGAPLELELDTLEGTANIELRITNKTFHDVMYTAGEFRGFHFEISSAGKPRARVSEAMFTTARISLSPGLTEKVVVSLAGIDFDLEPSKTYRLNIIWGNVRRGMEGLVLADLDLKTDAKNQISIQSDAKTTVTYHKGIPGGFPQRPGSYSNTIVPETVPPSKGGSHDHDSTTARAVVRGRIVNSGENEPSNASGAQHAGSHTAADSAEASSNRCRVWYCLLLCVVVVAAFALFRKRNSKQSKI